jgi:hypothetical protein
MIKRLFEYDFDIDSIIFYNSGNKETFKNITQKMMHFKHSNVKLNATLLTKYVSIVGTHT